MKRKTLISISAHIVAFLCLVPILLFSSCSPRLRAPSFALQEEVVRIPMIIENNRFYSYIVVGNDTVRMFIDTGATRSVFNYESATRTSLRRRTIDGGAFERLVPIRRINKMQWGDLNVENLLVAGDPGFNIIGDDILRHFIVQFDNENQEIVLTQNASLIEKRGIRVPFCRGDRGNGVYVSLVLNGKEGIFLLDTGATGELAVDADFFYSSGLSDLENVRWRGYLSQPAFLPEYLRREGRYYMTLVRHELGGMIFDNAIVTRSIHWHVNTLGSVFLQRFRTFTIDYLNGYVYFELPERTIFSDDNVIETVPPTYIELLRRRINTLGIHFSHGADVPTVSSLLETDAFAGIEVGDTLVAINQTALHEVAFYKLGADAGLGLEINRMILLDKLNPANEATFHFLKNGELISIHRTRDTILYPVPRVVHIFIHPIMAMHLRMIEDGVITADPIKDEGGIIIGFENIVRIPQPHDVR